MRVSFDLRSTLALESVISRFGRDGVIEKTRGAIRRVEHGAEFSTRGKAARLTADLDRFRVVELDFKAVEAVGQAFVDEVFGTWAAAHPETALRPINMTSSVEFMVHRGFSAQ